jgi:hypothetical protein
VRRPDHDGRCFVPLHSMGNAVGPLAPPSPPYHLSYARNYPELWKSGHVVSINCMKACRGNRGTAPLILVLGRIHVPAPLSSGKEPPVPIAQEAGWAPVPFWTVVGKSGHQDSKKTNAVFCDVVHRLGKAFFTDKIPYGFTA